MNYVWVDVDDIARIDMSRVQEVETYQTLTKEEFKREFLAD